MASDSSQIARRLKEQREAAGLTQTEAAALLGVVPMTISKRERGVLGISAQMFEDVMATYHRNAKPGSELSRLSFPVPRGTNPGVVAEGSVFYGPNPGGLEARKKIEHFVREMTRAEATDDEIDWIQETFRRPETARLAMHDGDGKPLTPKQVDEQFDALIEGMRHIITRRIERRKRGKGK